ncbi:hypothetical protein EVAR_78536_1 [Eumeta japonica]|uniref:Uncharacterized protein n=1 Tax=Eumeta variegata TaxID=151549 RepID=A0A4C1W638_EUMVA|nr:hypothetical protein EVAR_78536_1 [Eumeta japonica]
MLDANIPRQRNYKYLGVTLDKNLHFRDHIKRVRNTALFYKARLGAMLDRKRRIEDSSTSRDHIPKPLRAAVDYQPPPPTHLIRRPRNVLTDPPDALTAAVESLNDVNDTHDCLGVAGRRKEPTHDGFLRHPMPRRLVQASSIAHVTRRWHSRMPSGRTRQKIQEDSNMFWKAAKENHGKGVKSFQNQILDKIRNLNEEYARKKVNPMKLFAKASISKSVSTTQQSTQQQNPSEVEKVKGIFGNHLDASGKTINSDLELKNFAQVSKILSEIWSSFITVNETVEAEYLPTENEEVGAMTDVLDDQHWRCKEVLCRIGADVEWVVVDDVTILNNQLEVTPIEMFHWQIHFPSGFEPPE